MQNQIFQMKFQKMQKVQQLQFTFITRPDTINAIHVTLHK